MSTPYADLITDHAGVISTHAIDTTHGCHLNAERDGGALDGPLAFLTEAAEFMNADADVVAEVGIMPLPTGVIHGLITSTVTYADGSAIRFRWDGDGCAEAMEVLPSVGAAPRTIYA